MAEDLTPMQEAVVENEFAIAPADDISDRIAAYRKAKALEKQAKERAEEHRRAIASYLEQNDAEYGTVGGKMVVRWRTVTGSRIDPKKLRENHPDIAAEVTVTSDSHRLELIEE